MAFRVVRIRRNNRRTAKLEEIFQERDKYQCGIIDMEQILDIFRIYQVELDEVVALRYAQEDGFFTKDQFVKLGQDYKLLDFTGRGIVETPSTPRKKAKRPSGEDVEKPPSQVQHQYSTPTPPKPSSLHLHLLCCCPTDTSISPSEDSPDRIETAFRLFDKNCDGFLSWEEFQQMGKNTAMSQEQALRIFQSCDKTGRGKVSLEEFREVANWRPGGASLGRKNTDWGEEY